MAARRERRPDQAGSGFRVDPRTRTGPLPTAGDAARPSPLHFRQAAAPGRRAARHAPAAPYGAFSTRQRTMPAGGRPFRERRGDHQALLAASAPLRRESRGPSGVPWRWPVRKFRPCDGHVSDALCRLTPPLRPPSARAPDIPPSNRTMGGRPTDRFTVFFGRSLRGNARGAQGILRGGACIPDQARPPAPSRTNRRECQPVPHAAHAPRPRLPGMSRPGPSVLRSGPKAAALAVRPSRCDPSAMSRPQATTDPDGLSAAARPGPRFLAINFTARGGAQNKDRERRQNGGLRPGS